MIIGSIKDVTSLTAPYGSANGAALLHFYTMSDAITWAELQSQNTAVSGIADFAAVCTVINTDNGSQRWWWNGTEYTG
jgi:hypothetical protein